MGNSNVITQAAADLFKSRPEARINWRYIKRLHLDLHYGRVDAGKYQTERQAFLHAYPQMLAEVTRIEQVHAAEKRPAKGSARTIQKKQTLLNRFNHGRAKQNGSTSRPTEEVVRRLAELGLPPDLSRRLSHRDAMEMAERIAKSRSTSGAPPQRSITTLNLGKRKSEPLRDFPPEDGEATDAQLRHLKVHYGGKYGNRHKRH